MITFNLCKIEETGNFIELNFNSDNPSSLFTKLTLFTYENLNKSKLGIDLSYLLEKQTNKESFMINLIDLGFPNALNLFFIKVETNQNESEIAVTGNVTDIAINNLDRLTSLEQKKDCKFLSNCGEDIVDELLYNNLALKELPSLLELKKYDEARSLYYSVKDIITVPCEVFYKEFTIFTSQNEVRSELENIISDKETQTIVEEVEVEVEIDIETIPPRGEDIFNK